ncbi:MAG: ATP-binding protein, partial [Chloroflexota bacterium]
RNEIEINIDVWGEHSLPLDVQKSIFRIIQEALANVLWHSQAERVNVEFDFRTEILVLKIQDDGEGFDFDQRRSDGMGLEFMSERASLIGGELKIISKLGHGTSIILKYPYQLTEI